MAVDKAAAKKKKTGLAKDIKKASKLANNNLDLSPSERVDASRSSAIQDLIDQQRALSDPFSTGYAGRRSGEIGDYLSRLKDSTAGYDSAESQALRDTRRNEMERGFQSGRATLARGQNNYRLGATQRAAQLAELSNSYGQQSAQAENDLMVQNAAEKQRRLGEYGNAVTGAENNEFTRGQSALQNYQNSLTTAEANEYDKSKFNIAQGTMDKASKNAGTLGILGIQEARRNAAEQNRLIQEGYRSNESIARANNSGSNSSNGYAAGLQALIDNYKKDNGL